MIRLLDHAITAALIAVVAIVAYVIGTMLLTLVAGAPLAQAALVMALWVLAWIWWVLF